jgi:hypothetical protein
MIKTVPAGAMVQLGGMGAETAPAIFKAIPPGKYPVRVIMPDYETTQINADIKANEFTDLGTVTLLHSTGSLQVISSPPGSDFILEADGATQQTAAGKTPQTIQNLPTGNYVLTLKEDGWPDHQQTIKVMRNETLPVEWDFPSGTLVVDSAPEGASVYEQDRFLGLTPLSKAVAPATYPSVRVVLAGMVPVTLSGTVTAGQTTSLTAGSLQPVLTEVQLTTKPSGLEYSLSGTTGTLLTGTTPATLYNLPPGDYQATFKRTGWPDFTANLSLATKVPVIVDHEFPEGSIAITSDPAGASIFVGKRLLGVSPLTVELPPGDTDILAKLTGMTDRDHSITITDGEETTLAFDMKSGASSLHHRHHIQKPTPSPLAKLGYSIKSFFAGAGVTPTRPQASTR